MGREGYERPQYDTNRHQNGNPWDGAKGTENLVRKPPDTREREGKFGVINVVILHGYPPILVFYKFIQVIVISYHAIFESQISKRCYPRTKLNSETDPPDMCLFTSLLWYR